jgi:hypothetical protein
MSLVEGKCHLTVGTMTEADWIATLTLLVFISGQAGIMSIIGESLVQR